MNNDLKLSKHFCDNWRKHFDRSPTIELVKDIMAEAIRVQHCRDLLEKNGNPYRMLSIYWHPGLKLMLKIDKINNTAVSILSATDWNRKISKKF